MLQIVEILVELNFCKIYYNSTAAWHDKIDQSQFQYP